ncbi:MAG TPA: signal peptidase I [Blastocatellia bacterium]
MPEADYLPQASAEPSNDKPWRRRKIAIVIFGFVVVAFFGGLFVLWPISGMRPVRVQGNAMAPTLSDGDRILIGRAGLLKRGDIVVFLFPVDQTKSFIKRIIGLPGETISIDHSGKAFINGSLFPGPYIQPDRQKYRRSVEELKIPGDAYFVMGDNRDASNDSRSWGTVPRHLIYGVVLTRYWHATAGITALSVTNNRKTAL